MEKITDLHAGVKKLLTIRGRNVPEFRIEPRRADDFTDTLVWDGNRIPLFSSRYEPRIRAVARYGSKPEDNSALNVYSFSGSDVSLERLIYREFDIAEFILNSRIKKITAFVNRHAANIIAIMENGTAANIDLGNTMQPGMHNQCQHRLITNHGMANDLGVTDMTVQHQLYVYGQNGVQVYDDDEYYLYGLDEDEVAKVLTVHAVITGQVDWRQWADNDARYRRLIAAVFESDRLGKPVFPE